MQDLVRAADDLLDRGLPHAVVVVGRNSAEVDVHAAQVPALARDQEDVPRLGVDRALDAPVGEVGVDEDVHDTPGVLRHVTDVHPPDRLAHAAARTVRADDVPRPDGPLPRGILHTHFDARLGVLGHGEPEELDAVVGHDAARSVERGLGEVVEHARLVDDEVRELADVVRVVGGARAPHDLRGVGGVGAPEVHPADVVGLGDDALGEPERLEGLDAARLDAVGLTEHQPPVAPLDEPGDDVRVLGQLGGQEHPRRTRADDEDVDLVGHRRRPIGPGAGGGGDARGLRDVPVMVELHRRNLLDESGQARETP